MLHPLTRQHEQYKAHISLWAVLKSPLLISADLRTMSAKTLSILNNPGILAISQDPLGHSVTRIMRSTGMNPDKYGVGELQIWTGPLSSGDQVVLFLNAAGRGLRMSASLAEIFVADGPGGSAPQVKQKWDVYNVWAHRMTAAVAQEIVDAPDQVAKHALLMKANWYNVTETSYAEGLKNGDARLLGRKEETIEAGGTITIIVPRHGVAVLRLRSQEQGATRHQLHRDEL